MRLEGWDQGFVPRPPEAVYAMVADLPGYPRWWPGTELDPEGVTLRHGGVPPLRARPTARRPGEGLELELHGRWPGAIEWYLEPFEDGTVVNAFVRVEVPGGPRAAARRLRRLRVAIHRGLRGLREAA